MAKLIGIDTGGTYTDAVLFDEERGVLATGKALTTRHDLAEGIGAALDTVLRGCEDAVGMVSVSTTLATNAIVEGTGGRIGLVAVGFSPADLDRAGLRPALAGDPLLSLAGGHDAFGEELEPLDLEPLDAWLETAGAEAYAVASRFSVANPDHEHRVRGAIEARTGAPVTCSHDLSARLGGPRRALTAALNARLVPIVHRLVDAAESLLAARGIEAPLMIVKGDGSLLSVAEARRKPIETVLSGPAASLVGAAYLTGLSEAIVSDIGGTTTDIGVMRNGRPRLDPEGAVVGGHATFVEAVAMRTVGLGADSDVRPEGNGLALGPRRVVPLSLLAAKHPDAVHRELDRWLALPAPPETAGRFALRTGASDAPGRGAVERDVLAALAAGPRALERISGSYRARGAIARLVARGDVALAAFCPSDAAHVLGWHGAWDKAAAEKGATLLARQRGNGGTPLAPDAEAMSRHVVDRLIRFSAEHVLDAALAEDGLDVERPSRHPILAAALDGRSGLAVLSTRLTTPLVALGASAATYYPAAGALLGAETRIPNHAEVANAVGAVVGRVRVEACVTVSRPADDLLRVHGREAPQDFRDVGAALAAADRAARAAAMHDAALNGVHNPDVQISMSTVSASVADREMILEWRFTAVASGRPASALV